MSTREEVAETLREFKHKTYHKEEIVENICDAINIADPTNTFREPEDIYQLLAGIIDPTCWIEHSERIQDDGDGEYIKLEWHCTNCDFNLTERYNDLDAAAREELGLFYCPHCGTRIIGTIFDK
jgi:hypothetical protein